MKIIAEPNSAVIKAFVDNVPVEESVWETVGNLSRLEFVKAIALMPDCHLGIGSTIGTVYATQGAIIPASVGVDLSCGVMATKLSIKSNQLPDDLHTLRLAIEAAVPHGRSLTPEGLYDPKRDKGSWREIPNDIIETWNTILKSGFNDIINKYPKLQSANSVNQLGTLGTGNHYIELCIEKDTNDVWVMLHSGSRGIGNSIGNTFIKLAKKDMAQYFVNLSNEDLAYFPEHTEHYNDYIRAVNWAQKFAFLNRQIMMKNIIVALRNTNLLPEFKDDITTINCHHNYISHEKVYGKQMVVIRKGAIDASKDVLGIIPGSMGAKSFIVRGKGNHNSLNSASHGAGRIMSRNEARKTFTLEDHIRDTQGVECKKDLDVIDETPKAYKNIENVMEAQKDNVEILHELKQVICVKG